MYCNIVCISAVSGIISCVYTRMLSVNTVELSHFTTGETANFMSTDVDRVSGEKKIACKKRP